MTDGGSDAGGGGTPDAGGGTPDAGPLPTPDPVVNVPDPVPAVVADNPAAPADDGGAAMPWPSAPLMSGLEVANGRDSAIVVVPAVTTGARDYRVFPVPAGTTLKVDATGAEEVDGTDIYCAGLRQHNDAAVGSGELMREIQVDGLTGPTRLVVEAIDAACPFPGVIGSEHKDITVHNSGATAAEAVTFSTFTPDEIAARYGSVIHNGQGPAPVLAQQAPPVAPHVLSRTTIVVTPEGTSAAPAGFDLFDDFASGEQAVYQGHIDDGGRSAVPGLLWQTGNFSMYSFAYSYSDFFVANGKLHSILADWAQDVFASNYIVPRHTVTLSSTSYLRMSYDVESDATGRRYWWLFVCGADTAGQTLDASGKLMSPIVQMPFFYQPDGLNPSLAKWNCFQMFPRSGLPFALAPTGSRPESDIRVMENIPDMPTRTSVVNLSPDQYANPDIARPSWFRMQDAQGNLNGTMLDDQMLVSPETHFEVYLKRDRVILYVNGKQKLCNDFPSQPLTMPEAAIGFGQILYHSVAERHEFFYSFNDTTGQRYYIHDTPYIDHRTWDDLGYQQGVGAPADFDPSQCYVSP